MPEMVWTCVASWFFGENSVGRSTAREEGKRKTERNAIELATGDNKNNNSNNKADLYTAPKSRSH